MAMEDMAGGTFTISNGGLLEVGQFLAVYDGL
jgi:pyruvate/2-oxoglutarate dehydrogenase complex dihydrolipoamide acyltransferase (E2) component